MPDDVLMFWMIHLFLGILVPVLVLTGCCRRDEENETNGSTADYNSL
ncbi:MAG: hypothetical protein HY866_01255 [Chloroflexi bacterium]|nr:hypothetical protein [Chloroflexota bacterium]